MAKNWAYLYSDYIKALATASVNLVNEDPDFLGANLQDENVANVARTTNKTAIKIQATLGSSKAIQAFGLLNHNLNGGTYDLNSYTAADFSTGKVQIEANKAIRLLDMYHYEAAAPAARTYLEWDLTNATSADTYFEIGRAMLYDDLVTITEMEDWERERDYSFRNIINETEAGVRWVHRMHDGRERFTLRYNTTTQVSFPSELKTLFDAAGGNASPFLFVPNLEETDCYCMYLTNKSLKWTDVEETDYARGFNLELLEAVRGKS